MTSATDGVRLDVGDGRGGDRIPAILMIPPSALAPTGVAGGVTAGAHAGANGAVPSHRWPAALLLHGLTSDKERMASTFLGLVVAAAAEHVRAVVLAAGGDLPVGTPYDRAMRLVADPLRAVQRLGGRPLLMVHDRHDRTVSAAQAQRPFDAAREPKELKWWDAGHYLPDAAIADAARWMAATLAKPR